MNDCSHPLLLDEEELLRYVLEDEPLLPEALEHVNQCSLCQERISRYKQINIYLLKNVYRSTCPSAIILNHYVAQLLTPEEIVVTDQHLKCCPLCLQEVQDIRQVVADFDPFPEQPSQAGEVIEQHIALPVLGTYQESSERADLTGENRYWQVQYQMNDLLISLCFSQGVGGKSVFSARITFVKSIGQTCCLQGATAELCVVGNKSVVASEEVYLLTQINEDGNLLFEYVPEGIYTLFLYLPTIEIVIEDLLLKKMS